MAAVREDGRHLSGEKSAVFVQTNVLLLKIVNFLLRLIILFAISLLIRIFVGKLRNKLFRHGTNRIDLLNLLKS